MPLSVEFTVEPFVDGEPGPHVQAAVDAAQASGLDTMFGPFGTTMWGDDDDAVLAAIDGVVPPRSAPAPRGWPSRSSTATADDPSGGWPDVDRRVAVPS